ncbi:MAG: ATP-dependent Clp protease ATP-binding subunit, partial [Bradymonadaceae bacterium]
KLDVDTKALGRDLIEELELKPKNYRKSDQIYVADPLLKALERAGEVAESHGDDYSNVEHLLVAFAERKGSYAGEALNDAGATPDALGKMVDESETSGAAAASAGSGSSELSETLTKFGEDLTQLAADNKLDPIIGRDDEIRRVTQVLSRRTKNNPVLIGESGVGKTAVVEGLAQRIVGGDVPDGLKGKRIFRLDVGSLVAGTSLRGQFEERIKAIIKEIVASQGKILLFVDEVHQIVGAGGKDGSTNAANLLKPELARGTISMIGTTTTDEYREYIEDDAALERRFQTIQVDEVTIDGCISILRGIKHQYEIHHGVQITDPALVAAANMTDRYVTDRRLPDKAIDAIDEAGSRLRIEINSKPTELDALQRRIDKLKVEHESLADATDEETVQARKDLKNEIESLEEEAERLQMRWELERDALTKVTDLKEELEATEKQIEEARRNGETGRAAELKYNAIPRIKDEIKKAESELDDIHEEERLLKDYVGENDVAEVVADWTGIPVSKMMESEREKLLNMPDRLRRRVVGQDHAIEAISKSIWRSRAGLRNPDQPIGSFMFVGPTGVGKTELAKALSEFLFDSEDALIRIDMSEYMEKSKVNTLIGSARGYVGSEEGGVLTEAVRHEPYSVVLFDEAEKAHPDVFNILLQLMDEGTLTDSQGREVDFSNTLVTLTSIVGSRRIMEMTDASHDELTEMVEDLLTDQFRPEFVNRLDAPIVFKALSQKTIRKIVDIKERELSKLLADQKMTIELSDAAQDFLSEVGYEPEFGARPLNRAIGSYIQDPLAIDILEGNFGEGDHVIVGVTDDGEELTFRTPDSEGVISTSESADVAVEPEEAGAGDEPAATEKEPEKEPAAANPGSKDEAEGTEKDSKETASDKKGGKQEATTGPKAE